MSEETSKLKKFFFWVTHPRAYLAWNIPVWRARLVYNLMMLAAKIEQDQTLKDIIYQTVYRHIQTRRRQFINGLKEVATSLESAAAAILEKDVN